MTVEGKNHKLEADQIEGLRAILEHRQKRPVASDEAAEIGQYLIDFFELLADRTTVAEV